MKTFTDLYRLADERTTFKCVSIVRKAINDDPYGDPIEAFEDAWYREFSKSEDEILSWFKGNADFAEDVLENRFNGCIDSLWELLYVACALDEARNVSEEEYEAAVQYHVFLSLAMQFPDNFVDDETERKLKQCIADCIADHYSYEETISTTTESYMQSVIH